MSEDQQTLNGHANGMEIPVLGDEKVRPSGLLKNLSDSFAYVRRRRESGNRDVTPPPCVLPSFLTNVTVNFIDPTSSSITTTATTNKSEHLYEKFLTIFEHDCSCKLTYVPYQLFRNNSSGVIENLPIRTVVARSHGGGVVISDDTTQSLVHDYSWEQPYCHVYLAACESLEHYRTKVKPSIHAFVSQLEAAIKSKRHNSFRRKPDLGGSNQHSDSSSGSSSPALTIKKGKHAAPIPRYVIVYVPTGDRTKEDDSLNSPKKVKPQQQHGVGATVASRFAAARQRMAAVRGENMPLDSAHSGTTLDSSENNTPATAEDEVQMPPSIQKLNKVEREIARRFANDFPAGNVCTLSTLVDCPTNGIVSETTSADSLEDAGLEKDDSAHFQKLEWDAVLKAMATAITGGFHDRCQRFDEELRKLDQKRRGVFKLDHSDESKSERFHLSNFFLVKESLAFTYEQMRLPAEALLQYEELRAFLPDREAIIVGEGSNDGDKESLIQLALTGDILAFRRMLRSCRDFTPVIPIVEEYLFAREVALLFQLHKSVRVIQRCLRYVKSTLDLKKGRIGDLVNADESLQRLVELQKWGFSFCWDVKKASDFYFKEASTKTVNIAFARALCDVLEFARFLLEKLRELLLPSTVHRFQNQTLMQAVQGPWLPWKEPSPALSRTEPTDIYVDVLDNAFTSTDAFISRYLDLTEMIAECNEFCGRRRYAARLRIERMEMFDARGNNVEAAKEIHRIVDTYSQDVWNSCQFALLFRLASFQRNFDTASDYLATIIRCFGEAVHEVAPPKAVDALFTDLQAVVQCKSVEGESFAAAPLFGPVFGLEGIAAPRTLGTDRNLLKRLYTVGDKVRVTLSLRSFLPTNIEVDRISVNLVPFPTYVVAMEDNLEIKPDDICRELALKGKVAVAAGENEYTCEWLPKNAGQFIIASVFISWNGVQFTYTAKELRRPTIRIDIVPCDPMQTLAVKPNYLIPGHEQPLRFEFSAGTDIIKNGSLQLVGSPGLMFLPPNTEDDPGAWVPSFEVPLPPCPPSMSVCLMTLAKVLSPEESTVSIQPIQAIVSTTYKYACEEPEDVTTECINTTLKVKIPTLGKAALSVRDCVFVPYSINKAIVNVLLQCNTPAPITIKSWSIDLSRRVILSDNGDLNGSLANERAAVGEQISMTFDCSLLDEENSSASFNPALHIDFENEMGTLFRETLKLHIRQTLGPIMKPLRAKVFDVKISSATTEGLVGVPVDFTYVIDCNGLTTPTDDIVYTVAFDDAKWIVSGKVTGSVKVMDEMSHLVKIVAIPVRPGRITAFPAISLACGSSFLPVNVSSPPAFTALPPPSQISMAFLQKAVSKGTLKSNSS